MITLFTAHRDWPPEDKETGEHMLAVRSALAAILGEPGAGCICVARLGNFVSCMSGTRGLRRLHSLGKHTQLCHLHWAVGGQHVTSALQQLPTAIPPYTLPMLCCAAPRVHARVLPGQPLLLALLPLLWVSGSHGA